MLKVATSPARKLLTLALVAICYGIAASPVTAGQTIHIKVLVDEEEPRNDRTWQHVLVQRIENASAILAQYCDLRFSVTCFDTWQSNDRTTDFSGSLKEFEKEVKPGPAQLAIGFSSQYRWGRGLTNLGGTHGPLNSHILIREGSPSTQESERLEVLVHEMCHYLGAAHSGRSDSVMRPVLGDGRARERAFQIMLDPRNSEIVRLVSSEMLDFRVRHVHQLTIPTKLRLRNHYLLLARENPRDPVAPKYAMLMDKSIRLAVAQAKQRQQPGVTPNPMPRQGSLPNASVPPR